MQADGTKEWVEAAPAPGNEPQAGEGPAVWPSAVERLMAHPEFNQEARAALGRLGQADIDQIWAISQEEVASWPELMRSEHDVAACFIGWAMCWCRDTAEGHELHNVARIEGVGIHTRLKAFEKGRWEFGYSANVAETVARKAAQRAMRQALGPTVYRHLPFCVPELLHVDVRFDTLAKEKVDEWIDGRVKKVVSKLDSLFTARCLSDPRSLGALQSHYDGIGLIRRLGGEADASTPDGRRLVALLQRAPLAWQLARMMSLGGRRQESSLASELDQAEALIERWGGQLTRHHGVPIYKLKVAGGNWYIENDLRIRAAVIAQGTNLVNAGTAKGRSNILSFLEAWMTLPGAPALVMQPGFTIGPLFAGVNDCESEQLVRLKNSLPDCARWIGCSREPRWAQALLAMNFRELWRLAHDTHIRMGELLAQQRQRAAAREAEPAQEVRPLLGQAQEGGFRIVELMTRDELTHEGETMDHCVGTYWGQVSRRMCKILSVQDAEGARLATCQLTRREGRYRVAQLTGSKNASPPPGVREAVQALVEKLNTGAVPVDAAALAEYRSESEDRPLRLDMPKLGRAWVERRLGPWVGRPPVVIRRAKGRTQASTVIGGR